MTPQTLTLIQPRDITDLDRLTAEEKSRIDWPEPLKSCCGKCGSSCRRRKFLRDLQVSA